MLDTSAAIIHMTRVLIFEDEDRVIAVSVVQQAHEPRTADLVVLAVGEDVQGAWLRERPSRPLCVVVLQETLRFAAREGYQRILAMAAEQNTKSVRLVTRVGFVPITHLDGNYVLYQAALPTIEEAS